MMKKVLLLFAAAALLVSCTKNIDIVDEEGKDPGKNPSQSTTELTLQTIANPTRAIAEGTEVPKDNFIGFMPNFHSDIAGSNFDEYNRVVRFGYDRSINAWRGVAEGVDVKGLIDDYQRRYFVINPFYWPGGDRVVMDYVSYSYNNILDVLLSTLKNGYGLDVSMLGEAAYSYIDMVLAALPQKYNANRMDLWYQNKVLNVLGYALVASFLSNDSPILHPYSVAAVLVLSALIDEVETLGVDGQINPADIDEVIEFFMSDHKGKTEEEILETPPFNKIKGAYEFIRDYYEAYQIITHKITFTDSDLTKDRLAEVVNQGYWFFMNNLSKVSKYIQDDLMYAYDKNLKNTSGGKIQAKYNHAKSWVKVVVNNLSADKDILVSGIAFEDVKTGGSLVIDNSKTSFETYWDFDALQPRHDDPYGGDGTGGGMMVFDPYKTTTLDGEAVSTKAYTKKGQAGSGIKIRKDLEFLQEGALKALVMDTVFVPDVYLVPAGCYGPALSITGWEGISEASTDSVAQAESGVGPVSALTPAAGAYSLNFKFLSGESPFDMRVADNLGGAMFPAQEPGKLNIAYFSWENGRHSTGFGFNESEKDILYDMLELSKYFNDNSDKVVLHQATLNLPRKTWQMGKVYIYVISIADNEITIDACIEKDWEPEIVTPSYGPDVPGYIDRPKFFDDPNWGWN